MIFNLFSNISHTHGELEILQHITWKRRLAPPFVYTTAPTVGDPVANLLENIKNRNIDVLIPTKREAIPNLWNGKRKESVQVPIKPEKTNVNIKLPTKLPWEGRSPNFPTAQQKLILKTLRMVPVYTVVTQENELIMALPRDTEYGNVFTWLYKKYYEYFVWKEDNGPISIALFFMNKEDASLYMQSVGKNDTKAAEKGKIRIQTTSLDQVYYLNRTFPMGQQARLIADLEEVGKAIFSYIPSKINAPHVKQTYTKNEFVGTPIYTINLHSSKNGYDKIDANVMKTEVNQYVNRVFFKLEDAHLAWEKICTTNKKANLPIRPKIEIYNLEEYLEDLEKSPVKIVKKIQFTPSFKTIRTIKTDAEPVFEKETTPDSNSNIKLLRAFKYEKLVNFYKGLVWLFTSDALPTEDNAW
uniref:Uncharacterized protein n=1 Tax=Chroomonas mesostigmatica CCMP1168 TaxID=1195612 RepID=A0A248SPX5_9CRYP|nr:hypothetical protein CMESOPL_179 [Chroomonas mesostigmatica CCMP1168]